MNKDDKSSLLAQLHSFQQFLSALFKFPWCIIVFILPIGRIFLRKLGYTMMKFDWLLSVSDNTLSQKWLTGEWIQNQYCKDLIFQTPGFWTLRSFFLAAVPFDFAAVMAPDQFQRPLMRRA